MVAVRWLRWPLYPYMLKLFKILLIKRGCLGAESLHKSSGTRGLFKLLKWWSYIDVWPFYDEVKFVSSCFWDHWAHPGYFENRIPLKPALGGAYAPSQSTVLLMKRLNQTESPTSVILCVLCFQRKPFWTFIKTPVWSFQTRDWNFKPRFQRKTAK